MDKFHPGELATVIDGYEEFYKRISNGINSRIKDGNTVIIISKSHIYDNSYHIMDYPKLNIGIMVFDEAHLIPIKKEKENE
jgi:hypothetical protein